MKKTIAAILLLCLTVLLFACSGKGERTTQSVFGSGEETEPLTVRPLPYGKNAAVLSSLRRIAPKITNYRRF